MPERHGLDRLEQRREWLHEFLKRLWKQSTDGAHGQSKAVLWPLRKLVLLEDRNKVPSISVDVKPLAESNLGKFQEITRRLLVNPSHDAKKIGLSFYEEIVGKVNHITIPLNQEGDSNFTLKYSTLEGVADLETNLKSLGRFPSKPEQGRPNIKFRIIELFTDSRRELLKRYTNVPVDMRNSTDESLMAFLGQSDMVANNKFFKEEWPRLQSTPLTVIELIGRATFWDTSRGEVGTPQPINISGVRITETLDGQIVAERLAPWNGYNTWEKMNDEAQRYLGVEWQENFKLLDPNITTLLQAFR